MRRPIIIAIPLLAITLARSAWAVRLEVGLEIAPSLLHDDAYEAFSSDNLSLTRLGADLRSEVGEVDGYGFLPVLNYRYAADGGEAFGIVENSISFQELAIGLRVRKEVLFCLAVFVEVSGGLVWASLSSDITGGSDYQPGDTLGQRGSYTDERHTWSAGGLVGLEAYLSEAWLASRGVEGFNFGGEFAFGYFRRGDLSFDPTLEAGDEHALDVVPAGTWGDVNPSIIVFQLGLIFKFF